MKSKLNKLFLFIFGLLLCTVMMKLGFWQLDRAEQKRQLLEKQNQDLPELDLVSALPSLDPSFLMRRAKVEGYYQEQGTIYIDNQLRDGRVGYYLLSPLKVVGQTQLLMVNRGWLPALTRRDLLPEYTTPSKLLKLHGKLKKLPTKPLFWQDQYQVDLDQVWQYLPREYYIKKTGFDILPFMLELAPELEAVGGYDRQWPVVTDKGVEKHQAYAFQWFAMAAALFLICFIMLMKTTNRDNDNAAT